MRSRAASGVAVGAACVLLAGCGSSPTQQVRAKVQQFAVAVVHRDAKTICTEVFAPSLVERFTSAGLNCKRGLEIFFSSLHHPTLAVGAVKVRGSRASAMTLSGASGQTASVRPLELVKTSDGWRIVAVGAATTASGGAGGHQGAKTGTTTTGSTTTPTTTTKRTAPKHTATKKSSTSTKP